LPRASLVGRCVKTKLLAAAAVVTFLVSSCGATEKPATQEAAVTTPGVLVEDAWVRSTTGAKDTTMTAAFLSLTNPGDADVKLTSATSPIAGVVQLHEMAMQDGKVPLTLKFSDDTTHDLKVPVKAFTEEEEHYHPTPSTK